MSDHRVVEMIAELQARIAAVEPLAGTVLLDLGGDQIVIRGGAVQAASEDVPADCRVRLGGDVLWQILKGERDAFEAFLNGDIATEGDMSVAVHLQPLLSPGGR